MKIVGKQPIFVHQVGEPCPRCSEGTITRSNAGILTQLNIAKYHAKANAWAVCSKAPLCKWYQLFSVSWAFYDHSDYRNMR